MSELKTKALSTAHRDLMEAVSFLKNGHLVAFPTETVYGLGGDARNNSAAARIFTAKNRPSFNPLIVHTTSIKEAVRYAYFNDVAKCLAMAFWPGALTLVLPLRPKHGLSAIVTSHLPSVGIRVPSHPIAQSLLAKFDGPIAAPSANHSGKISSTTAEHVLNDLSGKIAAVIDGKACTIGIESTIVQCDNSQTVILRPGGISKNTIETVLQRKLTHFSSPETISSPGQLRSHYAPCAGLRLNVYSAQKYESHLGFAKINGNLNLSRNGCLKEAANNLFAYLHELDALRRPIAVAPIPKIGIGIAINDRLTRAATPAQ
ncbi:MAG: L-threonylcarbamoyladenylate synthase [Aestuariivita sp.]|nr:L-threonylcarbamoyladenylate synthase [Aestuariivita sp.]